MPVPRHHLILKVFFAAVKIGLSCVMRRLSNVQKLLVHIRIILHHIRAIVFLVSLPDTHFKFLSAHKKRLLTHCRAPVAHLNAKSITLIVNILIFLTADVKFKTDAFLGPRALHFDVAAQSSADPLADAQAEAKPARQTMVHAPLHLELVVGLKDALLVVFGDASALVTHANCDSAIAMQCELDLTCHCDSRIGRRMLDRICDQVGQHLLQPLCIEPDFGVSQSAQFGLYLNTHLLCLHLVQVNAILHILSQVGEADHGDYFPSLEQIIVQQVLRVTHQQLAAIVDHSTHFPGLLVESFGLFDEGVGEADDAINGHDHVVTDGGLVLLHNSGPFILDVKFLLGRNIFEAYYIVGALTAREFDLLAADLVDDLLAQVLLGYLALELDQLVHLKRQRLIAVRVLANQEDNVHERDALVLVRPQEIIQCIYRCFAHSGLVLAAVGGYEGVLDRDEALLGETGKEDQARGQRPLLELRLQVGGAVGKLGDLVAVVVVFEERGETYALVFATRLNVVRAASDALVRARAVIGDHHSLVVFIVQRHELEQRLEAKVRPCLLERALLDLAEVNLV